MFKWIKNQFMAKFTIEKFLSKQYVKFIDMVCDMLINQDLTKWQVEEKCRFIRSEIIKKYNLTENDLKDEK